MAGGGVASGAGRATVCGGGLGRAGSSCAARGTGDTPDPSGRPIRSPRDDGSLVPRLTGGAGGVFGTGRRSGSGAGWGAAIGGLGGATTGGGSTSRTRSGLSGRTGCPAISNSRPTRPEWTARETANDLLRTDRRIAPRCGLSVSVESFTARRLYGTTGRTTSTPPRAMHNAAGFGPSWFPKRQIT